MPLGSMPIFGEVWQLGRVPGVLAVTPSTSASLTSPREARCALLLKALTSGVLVRYAQVILGRSRLAVTPSLRLTTWLLVVVVGRGCVIILFGIFFSASARSASGQTFCPEIFDSGQCTFSAKSHYRA